jgi:hypothetical protein
MNRRIVNPLMGVLCVVLSLPALGTSQEEKKVYRKVSSDRLESILKNLEIDYKKSGDKMPDTHFYDFERNKQKVRLGNHGGVDLWIDCVFDKATLETINQWNVRAKFSRAVLTKLDDKEMSIVEFQLDCAGGVTDDMIRQFIRRFDEEVKAFDKFLNK